MIASMTNAITDSGLGIGVSILSFIGHSFSKNSDNVHEERMARYKFESKNTKQEMADVKNARKMIDPFSNLTRRGLVWGIVFFAFMLPFIAAMRHIPIVMFATNHYRFFGISWVKTTVVTAMGYLYYPWIQQIMSMFIGFYCGKMANR